MKTSNLHHDGTRRLASESGFGSVGRVARGLSCVLGGVMLGTNYGMLTGVAGGLLGLAVFAFAERVNR